MGDSSEESVPGFWNMTMTMYPNATKHIVAAAKHRRAYDPPNQNKQTSTLGISSLPKLADHVGVVRPCAARKEQIYQIPEWRSDSREIRSTEF